MTESRRDSNNVFDLDLLEAAKTHHALLAHFGLEPLHDFLQASTHLYAVRGGGRYARSQTLQIGQIPIRDDAEQLMWLPM